jgi:hypothetical protein
MGLDVKPDTAAPAAPAVQHIHLELAIYKRYTRQGQLYTSETEQGQPMIYRFTLAQARVLLTETDAVDGRPIWRRPRARVSEQQRQVDLSKPVVQDVTTDRVADNPVVDHHPDEPGVHRLDDGTDEELEALLGHELPEGPTVQI